MQTTTEQLASIKPYKNITDLLIKRVQEAPDHPAFDVPDELSVKDAEERWLKVSTSEFLNDVKNTAKHLIHSGVKPGQTVAIMSASSYRWAVADLAIWFAGAIVVPIYETASQTQVKEIVKDAGILFAFSGDELTGQKLKTTIQAAHAKEGTLLNMQDLPPRSGLDKISDAELEKARTFATKDDVATIVYTSGTSGKPKGVVLTHNNFLAQVLNIAVAYDKVVHSAGNTIIFLPLAHVLARGLQLICIASGMRIAHLSDTKKVISTFKIIKPTFIVVVPRVLEKIQQAVADKAQYLKLSWLWNRAVKTAISYGVQQEECDFEQLARVATKTKFLRFLFDRIFYNRVRKVLGGKIEYILSGGAPLQKDISLFFRGAKIPIIEGYGLTETTAPLTGNLPGRTKSGTVGRPLPGITVRISDSGEVLAKGQGVFSGYRNEESNKEAFDAGFFRTGDLGSLDSDGYLTLEGRISDTIVTSNGKTVVPEVWERAVVADPLISHAVVIAVAALVALAGGQGGVQIYGLPIYIWAVIVAFLIQIIVYIPAYLLRSEKFFDLTGASTYTLITVLLFVLTPEKDPRSIVLAGMVIIWAIRLGPFLFFRVRKAGADQRFDELKQDSILFLRVWIMQGLWVSLTASAAWIAMSSATIDRKPFGFLEFSGIALWVFGFVFEVVADLQKSSFKADAANDGRFIKTGLWAYSRHPNYFGEIVLWTGVFVVAAPALTGWQWIAVI